MVAQRGDTHGAAVDQGIGAALVVSAPPAPHGLGAPAGVRGHPRGTSPLVSVRKPDLEIIGFLSRRRRHLERSPSGTRLCSQPENANFLSEMFPDRHSGCPEQSQRLRSVETPYRARPHRIAAIWGIFDSLRLSSRER